MLFFVAYSRVFAISGGPIWLKSGPCMANSSSARSLWSFRCILFHQIVVTVVPEAPKILQKACPCASKWSKNGTPDSLETPRVQFSRKEISEAELPGCAALYQIFV